MITETRKQIIELIEPYMDKTLSEGCYIGKKDGRNKGLYQLKEKKGTLCICKDLNDERKIREFVNIDKYILGHYDITAVLKYVYSKGWSYMPSDEKRDTLWIYRINEDIEIPNKPLHLYTEQEEKDLLELLLSLK